MLMLYLPEKEALFWLFQMLEFSLWFPTSNHPLLLTGQNMISQKVILHNSN